MDLKTERLLIRKLDESMATSVSLNSLDQENRRFLPDEVFETKEDALSAIQYLMSRYETEEGPFVYAVLLKDGKQIGHVQLVKIQEGWEVGFLIGKAYRGRGYALEAVQAFLPIIMEKKKLFQVLGITSSENIASQRVLDRLGFVMTGQGPGSYQGREEEIQTYSFSRYKTDSLSIMETIDKGWSADRKFRVTMEDGQVYLLRLASPAQKERKAMEFETMRQLARLNLPFCRPAQTGVCENFAFSLQEWITGQDAEEVIPLISRENQYRRGREAGRALTVIHSLPPPSGLTDWESRFNEKTDRKIDTYLSSSLRYPKDRPLLDYIEGHRHLLAGRPQSFQHGDFHIGNMMIDGDDKLRIIDFDRFDYGDPWEEFNRIVFTASVSPAMAAGMVDAYFEDAVPEQFWQLLALYIAVNTLSSFTWALSFSQTDIKRMIELADQVLDWYQGMTRTLPSWYPEPGNQPGGDI